MNTKRKATLRGLAGQLDQEDIRSYSDVAEELMGVLEDEKRSHTKYVNESNNHRKDFKHRTAYATYAADSSKCQLLMEGILDALDEEQPYEEIMSMFDELIGAPRKASSKRAKKAEKDWFEEYYAKPKRQEGGSNRPEDYE